MLQMSKSQRKVSTLQLFEIKITKELKLYIDVDYNEYENKKVV